MVYEIFCGISLEWVCGCEATLPTSGKVLKVRKCWCGRILYVVETGSGSVLVIKETQSHRANTGHGVELGAWCLRPCKKLSQVSKEEEQFAPI